MLISLPRDPRVLKPIWERPLSRASQRSAPELCPSFLRTKDPLLDPTEVLSIILNAEKGKYFSAHSFRITRAFLIEEVKLIKRMMQQKESTSKKGSKDKKKSSKK